MAKPKAESWLTTAFYEGVTAYALETRRRPAPAYKGALGRCWLAQHDGRRKPCSGPFERFHFMRRATVEDSLWAMMLGVSYSDDDPFDLIPAFDLIAVAAWDPRNGEIACEGHHRRYDHAAGPPLTVPVLALPIRTVDFVFDWGLDTQAEDRFPGFKAALIDDRDAGYAASR